MSSLQPEPASVRGGGPHAHTLETRHRALAAAFRAAAIETAALDARLLLCAACGLAHAQFVAEPKRSLSDREEALIARYAARRLAGEPVSRILGQREFWGLSFALEAHTLDPRPDTETLVGAALELCRAPAGNAAPRLLDLGTGSGCILLALLHELPDAQGVGVDRAPDAVAVARRNARRLGLADRAAFCCGSWGEALSGRFDLLLCNPPYIATGEIAGLDAGVARYDPRAALDGGADGLACYRQIVPGLPGLLAPGGWVLFEVGAGQASAVLALLARHGLGQRSDDRRTWRDLAGRVRCVGARAAGPIGRREKGA